MTRDLPKRLHFKDGGYYHIVKNKWTFLGADRKCALKRYARIEHGLPAEGTEPAWTSMPRYLAERFRAAKNSASTRGIQFSLTRADFDQIVARANGLCEVTGIPFDLTAARGSFRRPWAPSLDRISSADHYHLGNCRLVCGMVNWAMSDWGEAAFWKMVRRARRWLRGRKDILRGNEV